VTSVADQKNRRNRAPKSVLTAGELTTEPVQDAAGAPSFAEVFKQNAAFVWRALLHFGVPTRDVEDTCQEVFVVVHRHLSNGVTPRNLRPWLYGICWKTAAAQRRRAHQRREVPAAEADPGASPESTEPTNLIEQRRRFERLDSALALLTEDQRAVFVLYEIEQLTMREIAETLGCSINTAFSRLYAARRRVANALGIVVPEEVWKR
jgi:RNA polymerase sigma-70 factor, ECF subfamily